ncbi:molybdate ABC transporter substrate-binding protein [Methanopyrus sp. KOL6]|uniref:molybdate ABC transporter substrate-binding protein n=1 Tax=Methanopyrus sp. KOL6 TaxID=1937004 RepID=UPI000B4A93C4|nr:molybdate ABC transporter substrate-binding protein [Methanopyrus sp. KOL6]
MRGVPIAIGILSVVVIAAAAGYYYTSSNQLTVFAAASLKKPLTKLAKQYEKEKGVKVALNFGPSGGLTAQILQGQKCDLFFSADWKYVVKLQKAGKTIKTKKFLKDYLVLVVSKTGKEKGIKDVKDITKPGVTVAVADPKAPVGEYTQRALKKLGLWDTIVKNGNLKARPGTVNQVATMVKKDQIDAGFVYRSVAIGFGLPIVQMFPHSLTGPIIWGAAVIKGGNERLAEDFLNYCLEHIDEFKKYRWSPA